MDVDPTARPRRLLVCRGAPEATAAEARRLVAFCGLPWDDACLAFQNNAAPVATASSVQVRRPLYASSIGRWRRYGERADGLLDQLGMTALADTPSG